ncbi:MAG: hypothetical protein GY772_24435, partial [bacterium]|nr:hypothetical protein [bacterium]
MAEDERFAEVSAELIDDFVPIKASYATLDRQRALRPPLGENAGNETRHGRVPAWTKVSVPMQPNLDDPRIAVGPEVFGSDADPALLAWRAHAKVAALAVLELCKPEMVSPLLQSGVENFAPMMGGILAQVGVGPLATRLLPDEWATLSVHRGEQGTFQHPLPPRPLDPATAPIWLVTDSALNMDSSKGKTYAGRLIKQWHCPNLNFRYESGATAVKMWRLMQEWTPEECGFSRFDSDPPPPPPEGEPPPGVPVAVDPLGSQQPGLWTETTVAPLGPRPPPAPASCSVDEFFAFARGRGTVGAALPAPSSGPVGVAQPAAAAAASGPVGSAVPLPR